jgi:predicted ArsR family transcriptional regulator
LDALEHLEADGPLTPRELAGRLQLTSGGTTVLLDRLERQGWVRRRRHPGDRRSVLVELDRDRLPTPPEALARYESAVEAAARAVASEHRAAVSAFLRAARDAAAAAAEPASTGVERKRPPDRARPAPGAPPGS